MSSEGALPRSVATGIIAALLGGAAVAWLVAAQQAASMGGMGGIPMVSSGLFLWTWVVMMMAMMLPAAAPMVLTHAGVVRSRGEGVGPTAAFVVGYLLIWIAAGLVPLGVMRLLGSSIAAPLNGWLPRIGGAVVVLAGLYQLSPMKSARLRACRSPLGFMLTHDLGAGNPAAARAGIAQGIQCLGCCWALMAVLAVLGFMDLAWMAAFAVVFFLEKTWRHGIMLSRTAGAACLAMGLAVIVRPDVLHLLAGPMG